MSLAILTRGVPIHTGSITQHFAEKKKLTSDDPEIP